MNEVARRFWLLSPRRKVGGENPWDPWFDKMFGVLVLSASESDARALAALQCGEEGEQAWLDERFSECVPLDDLPKDKDRVVLRDFASA